MSHDGNASDDSSEIELDVPEWGSSSDEDGGWEAKPTATDAKNETGDDGLEVEVLGGGRSDSDALPSERRGVMVAISVRGEPSEVEREVVEARVREVCSSQSPARAHLPH